MIDQHATAAHRFDNDGGLTVWLSVVSQPWLANLLMRCGPGAEVLEPDDLVDLPRHRAGRLLRRDTRRDDDIGPIAHPAVDDAGRLDQPHGTSLR